MEDDLEFFANAEDRALWDRACALRRRYWGRDVFLRGIVEFSSYCEQNCLYCGLRKDNTELARYRLGYDEIFAAAKDVRDLGIGTVVLQSGEDPEYDGEGVAELIRRIKRELGLAVTLSLGERCPEDYALWREAGADRYLLKMETFRPEDYHALRGGKAIESRIAAYETLRSLGYECGNGIILGLPGETAENLQDEFAALAALRPEMLAVSPFTPHPQTPLIVQPAPDLPSIFRAMAMARISVPTAHIPATSALGLLGNDVRLKALEVADVLMPSLTPETVREAYAIYPGKNSSAESPVERARAIQNMLRNAGFTLPSGPGGAWTEPGNQGAPHADRISG